MLGKTANRQPYSHPMNKVPYSNDHTLKNTVIEPILLIDSIAFRGPLEKEWSRGECQKS